MKGDLATTETLAVTAIPGSPIEKSRASNMRSVASAVLVMAVPVIVWFAPFVLAALFGQYSTDRRRREPDEIETAAIVAAATPAVR